jgi:GT2 family glycosyltransferase
VGAAGRNGGFSAGNNAGIRASDAEFYLLLNSDTLVRPGALAELLRAAREHPEAGLIGPRLEDRDGTGQNSAFRSISPLGQLVSGAKTGVIDALLRNRIVPMPVADQSHACEWISFACVLVRRHVLEVVGPMDEGMFMYFEDADYGLRVRDAGFSVWYWPAARVVHFGGGSGALVVGRRLPKYYFAARSRYFVRHFGLAGWVLGNLLWDVGFVIHATKSLLLGRPLGKDHLSAIDVWTLSADTPAGRLSAFARTDAKGAGWIT